MLAKLANPDWPRAAAGVPPDAHGEDRIPNCDDCPKPTELGWPKALFGVDEELPKVLDPNTAPAGFCGVLVAAAAPHGDDF